MKYTILYQQPQLGKTVGERAELNKMYNHLSENLKIKDLAAII